MSEYVTVTPELLAGFLDEAPEYLEMLDEGLMAFESKAGSGPLAIEDAEDHERMNRMFRAAHSLKGLGAAMGFDKIRDLTHLMETLFDQVRMGKRALEPEGIETLFRVFDKLKALVQELSDPPDEPVTIDDALATLNDILSRQSKPAPRDAAPAPTPEEVEGMLSEACPTEPNMNDDRLESSPSPEPAEAAAKPMDPEVPTHVDQAEEPAAEQVNAVFKELLAPPVGKTPGLSLDDPELIQLFVETTAETIEELNQELLKLEQRPDDLDVINEIFRCAHNIKGATGVAGCTTLYQMTHDMETVLDRLRSRHLNLDDSLENALLAVADRLVADLELIKQGRGDELCSDGTTHVFDAWLKPAAKPSVSPAEPAECEAVVAASASPSIEAATPATTTAATTAPAPPPAASPSAAAMTSGDHAETRVRVTFPKDFIESEIQAYLIHNKLAELGDVLRTEPDINALDGTSTLTEIVYCIETGAEPEELERIVKSYMIESVHAEAPTGSSPKRCEQPEQTTPEASACRDEAIVGAAPCPSTDDAPPAAPIHAAVAAADSPAVLPQSHEAPPLPAMAPVTPGKDLPPADVNPARADKTPAASEQKSPKPTVPAPAAMVKPAATAKTASTGVKTDDASPGQRQETAKVSETIRVDLDRLDQLMNLGGELVINKARFFQIQSQLEPLFSGENLNYMVDDISNRLGQLSEEISRLPGGGADQRAVGELSDTTLMLTHDFEKIKGMVRQVHDSRSAMNDFSEALHSLNRISESLQKRIMETRMVPIGPLFQRFRRVVRDLSKSTGKEVELVLRGESTELDKRMIDELGDPLTHMIRNSVDHGIELPEEREQAGKPRTAHVTLDAYHRGRHICIEVRDDGRGINVPAIRKKIVERELVTPAQAELMSDKELIQYIFKPGFSTAEKVTDLSGRGMGMDIVMSKLENLNGTVEVESVAGEGAVVTIRLPLTLAIITALLARIGKYAYAVPLETVAEIITVKQKDLPSIQRQRVVRVRDHVIPVAMFEEIFNASHGEMQTATRQAEDLTLVILGYGEDRIGLIVDEMIGQDDVVIKNLAANYRNVTGIAGASIMGDGSVSLILDVAAMMTMFTERRRPSSARVSAPAEILEEARA